MKPLRNGIRSLCGPLAGLIFLLGMMSDWVMAQAPDVVESNEVNRAVIGEPAETQLQSKETRRALTRPRDVLQLGGPVSIAPGEEAQNVVVVFGEANVQGTVRGDVVVVFGRVTVEGEVRGSLVAPLTKVRLESDSRIEGDLVAVLGELDVAPTAQIGGERIDLSMTMLEERLPAMEGLKEWLTHGLLLGRPLPHQSGWWWGFAVGCAIFYFVLALIFARPLSVTVAALELRPMAALFLGLLVFILVGPLLLMLAATGIGLVVVPAVVAAVMVAFVFGKIAVAQFLGRELGRQVGLKILTIPLVALLIGIMILCLVYMVPVIGLLAWSVTSVLGVGAAAVALFTSFRMESTTAPALSTTSEASPAASTVIPDRSSMEPPIAMAPMPQHIVPPSRISESTQVPAGPAPVFEAPPPIPGQKPVPAWVDANALPRVGFWARLGAALIDVIVIGVLVALLHRVAWFIPIWVAYHVGMWAWRGTTIGGIVFGLWIARMDGRAIDFPIALVRSLSSFLSAIALFLGFFWAGWTREKRAWHDLIAGTMIVRLPKGTSPL